MKNKFKMKLFSKPEELFKLANKIIKRHTDEGANSPLPKINIAKMNFKLNNAQNLHNLGTQYQELAKQAFEERDRYIGIESIGKENSLSKFIKTVFESLVGTYNGKIRYLEKWGFKLDDFGNNHLIR
jgi:hypothetical protein